MEQEERIFKVMKSEPGYGSHPVDVKESELTSKHIDMFTGYLLQAWDNCPKKTQMEFMQMLSHAVEEKYKTSMYERFKNVLGIDDKEELDGQ